MHITWLGRSAVKLQTKPQQEDVTIVIDPYKPEVGQFPRSLTPHIALYTRGQENSITLSGDPFVMDSPGEVETRDILIVAAPGHDANDTMYRVDSEGISVGHLGLTKKTLTSYQEDILSGVDVLLIPVGHADTYDAEAAMKTINTLEPRVIIPIAYKSDIDPDADDVTLFLKEMGVSDAEPEKKTIIKKSTLPQEDTQVIVLEKE